MWDKYLKSAGIKWPSTYMCLDLEHSGQKYDKILTLQLGHHIVVENKVVDSGSYVLNWAGSEYISEYAKGEMADRCESLRAKIGQEWDFGPSRQREVGEDPKKILEFYRLLIKSWSFPVVTQLGVIAEEPALRSNFQRFLSEKVEFKIKEDLYFDLGLVYLGYVIFSDAKFNPYRFLVDRRQGESLRGYLCRLRAYRIPGAKYNLDKICNEFGIDSSLRHDAETDSLLLHEVIQKVSKQLSAKSVENLT